MKKNQILLIFLFVISLKSFSQTILNGSVSEISKKAIPYASVVLKSTLNENIVTYSFSDENGSYDLETSEKGSFTLHFSALGFATKIVPLRLTELSTEITINALLAEETLILNEVIVQAEKPINISNDTINFKTKFFTNGTEQNVEDLLKKIPGLTVDAEGTIKVGNQEIEKLMVDGDDFFERGYKVLSKSMPAYPIEEVEILRNYSNHSLLKGIEESDKVALNIKMNETSKRIWFGNFNLGYGLESKNRYELKGNLMNFGKKNKYYFLTNLNNTGYDAIGDVQNLVRPFRPNEPGVIGDNISVSNLLGLNGGISNFKRERSNFNNAELLSLNAIFNPTEKLKIKTLAFFNADETNFFRNATKTVNVNSISFTNTEDFRLRNKNILGFGKLDFIYTISKTKSLEATTKYNSGNENNRANLLFNGRSTLENLKNNNSLFDQKITYSNKFKKKKVFLVTARYIQEETPQNYTLNQFLFDELFTTNTNANNVKQAIENKLSYIGVNAHLLDRRENDDLLEVQVGNEYRSDILNTAFEILQDNTTLNFPLGYQNNVKYRVNDLYLKSKYRLKINDFGLFASLDFHQLYNNLQNEDGNQSEAPFFINPSFGTEWKINDANKIKTSYSYNTTNAKILDIYDNYVLTSFRSFQQGLNSFNQLNNSSIVLNYELGNWSDRFFANTFMMYSKNYDFFSTNTFLDQNFTLSEVIRIEDREFLSINSKIDYYFRAITSNLKLDVGYAKSNFKNSINNGALREVKTENYKYGLEMRSGFRGFFNYHLGTKWITNIIKTTTINDFTDNTSFLDLSFLVNENIDFQLQSERYFFGNLTEDNTYYFLDFDARYKMFANKLTIALTGKNLFNTETLRNVSISDIGSSTTEFRLLPRFVLLKLEYRF